MRICKGSYPDIQTNDDMENYAPTRYIRLTICQDSQKEGGGCGGCGVSGDLNRME